MQRQVELVCQYRDLKTGEPCFEVATPGDNRCPGHWGTGRGTAARRIRNVASWWVGKSGPVKEDFTKDIEKGFDPREAVRQMRFGGPRDVDPGVALLEEIHRSAGHVAWLETRVRDLEESELVWGKVMEVYEEKTGGGPTGDYELIRKENRSVINAWWDLYQRERSHLAKVSVAALKAGIEERKVRLAERGVDALENALALALADLGLDPSDAQVRSVVGGRLREALEGGESMFQGVSVSVPNASTQRAQPVTVDAAPATAHEPSYATRPDGSVEF